MRLSRRTRAVLAFAALPGVVAFGVPLLMAWSRHRDTPFWLPGLLPLVPGVLLLAWCSRQLTTHGQGTLAPWDPPRRLVTGGAYRRSRNPMYIGVSLVLVAWALGFRSWPLALYAAIVMLAFHLRVVLSEEPQLARVYGTQWTRYASQVPRWIFPSRTAFGLALVALLAAVPIAGVFYEVYADAKAGRDFPPPGTFVDVGGRRLHVVCIGEGAPVVVFEPAGSGPGSIALANVRERVARHTQVCSYDRAGTGWSDPGPDTMSSADLARDLAVLQDRAGLPSPVVVVASSIGGLTAEMFARQYPERVAGLVLLDAAHSGSLRSAAAGSSTVRATATLVSLAAHLGLVRLWDPLHLPADSEDGRRVAAMTYGAKAIDGVGAVVQGLPRSRKELDAAPPLPADVPIVVLSASSPGSVPAPWLAEAIGAGEAGWIPSHQALASTSSRGSWQLVPDSDHLIAASQPDVVIDVLVTLFEETRAAGQVRLAR